MKKFKFLLLCTLLATAFVACDDESEKVDQPVLPTVEVEAGEAGEGTLTFTVTSADAETVKYVVIEAGSREVTADLILANGSTATANEAYEATQEGLMYETTYEIWAAARNADGVALSEKVEMTTLPKGDEPGPGDEYTDVNFEAEEADAYIEDGIHNVDFFTGDYTVAVAWRGEEKIVEISDEDGSLLLDYMGVYDRTGGSQESKFVSIVSGYFYTEDEGDGNYWAEGEFITSDNRRFLLSYWGPVNGWSEGGDDPIEIDPDYLSFPEDVEYTFVVEKGLSLGEVNVMAFTEDEDYGFALTLKTNVEGADYILNGQYVVAQDQEQVDEMYEAWGYTDQPWITEGGIIVYEGEEYYLSSAGGLDYGMQVETAWPAQDMNMITFCLLSEDLTKAFTFSYMGAIYGGGDEPGDDTNIQRSPRDIDYNEIREFSFADGYTTVKFTGFGGDLQLCFNTGNAPLATADGWTEYDVATDMDLAKSYYAEFIEDEMYFYLQSGEIAVKATATGYIFVFYDVKTGAGTGASWGVELNTHSQGFEATLPQVEPDITTISSAYTPGNYVIDRAQVVCIGLSYIMLADQTGVIPGYYYDAPNQLAIGDYVSIDGTSVANGSFPAQFNSATLIEKIESGEYTYPQAYNLSAELDAFAANPSYRYVSVTGTITTSGFTMKNYYLAVDGQTTKVKLVNLSAELQDELAEAEGEELTIQGYTYGGGSGEIQMMITKIGADEGGSGEPTVDVTFAPKMGIAGPADDDFFVDFIDSDNGLQAGLYIECTGLWEMYGVQLPWIPSGPMTAASSSDLSYVMNEGVGMAFYLDVDKSYIMYNGKEYKIAAATESLYSGLNNESYYDGSGVAQSDINIWTGNLYTTDGSVFHFAYTGALYTNSMIGGL